MTAHSFFRREFARTYFRSVSADRVPDGLVQVQIGFGMLGVKIRQET